MNDPKFKEGDWVKEKNGTKGMTVVSNNENDSGFTGEVLCRFKNEEGENIEQNFKEADLVPLA